MLRGCLGRAATAAAPRRLPSAAPVAAPTTTALVAAPVRFFAATNVLLRTYAHWYAGRLLKHRNAREKRFSPKTSIRIAGTNFWGRKLSRRTNRWNYIQAYKDMP